MGSRTCCVIGCNKTRTDNTILHLFPNPDKDIERFNLWTNAIGRGLWSIDNQTIYQHRRVCHTHFETKYQTRSRRLSANAVPTLFLSGYICKTVTPQKKSDEKMATISLLGAEAVHTPTIVPYNLASIAKMTLEGDTKAIYYDQVEGIASVFIPEVLDKKNVDKVIRQNDYESFNPSRELVRKEGLLCESHEQHQLSNNKQLTESSLRSDGIRNYMTEYARDQWTDVYLFKEPPEIMWWNRSISTLHINQYIPRLKEHTSCYTAISAMGSQHSVALVIDNDGFIKGVITKDSLRSEATNPKRKGDTLNFSDPIERHLIKTYYMIAENQGDPTVGLASRILDKAPFVIIAEEIKHKKTIGYIPKGIVTADIMLDYIMKHQHTPCPEN